MSISIVENVFVFLMLVAGIILILTSFTIYDKLTPECPSGLKTKARIGVGVGSIVVSLALGYYICHLRCDCGGDHTRGASVIMGLSFLLGVFMFGLTGFIDKDIKDKCKVEGVQNFIKASYYTSGGLALIGILFFVSKLFLKGKDSDEDLSLEPGEKKGLWDRLFKKETPETTRQKALLKTERDAQALAREQALSERETQAHLTLKLQQHNTVISQDNKKRASQGLKPIPLMSLSDILRTSGSKEQVLAEMAETKEKVLSSLSPEQRAQAEREEAINVSKRETYQRGIAEKEATSRLAAKTPDATALAATATAKKAATAAAIAASHEKASTEAFEAQKKQNERNLELARQTAELARSQQNIDIIKAQKAKSLAEQQKAQQQFLDITTAEAAAKENPQQLTSEQIIAQAEAKAKQGQETKAFFKQKFTK